MPTSRALPRPAILPKSAAPRRVMHWRQDSAQPPVPLANRPVQHAVEVPEEVQAEVMPPAPVQQVTPILVQIHQDKGKVRYEGNFFLQLAALAFMLGAWFISFFIVMFESIAWGLVLFIFSTWLAQRVKPNYFCSLCRGIVHRKAKKCQHCGCKF